MPCVAAAAAAAEALAPHCCCLLLAAQHLWWVSALLLLLVLLAALLLVVVELAPLLLPLQYCQAGRRHPLPQTHLLPPLLLSPWQPVVVGAVEVVTAHPTAAL